MNQARGTQVTYRCREYEEEPAMKRYRQDLHEKRERLLLYFCITRSGQDTYFARSPTLADPRRSSGLTSPLPLATKLRLSSYTTVLLLTVPFRRPARPPPAPSSPESGGHQNCPRAPRVGASPLALQTGRRHHHHGRLRRAR